MLDFCTLLLSEIFHCSQSWVACRVSGYSSKEMVRLIRQLGAKTSGINQALSLDYLKFEGLYSLRDGWIALHYPK